MTRGTNGKKRFDSQHQQTEYLRRFKMSAKTLQSASLPNKYRELDTEPLPQIELI